MALIQEVEVAQQLSRINAKEGQDCHRRHLAYAGKRINYYYIDAKALLSSKNRVVTNFEKTD